MTTFITFLSLLSIASTIFNIFLSTFSPVEANINGDFSIDLIHRDSTKSPFYDTSITSYKLVSNAIQRSISRVNHLGISSASTNKLLLSNPGDYILNISIGSPPVTYVGFVDTGSDLTWIQCEPCPKCHKQKRPLFSPKNSSTYKEVPCHSRPCESFEGTSCLTANGSCQYTTTYLDESFTNGVLATETLTLQSTTVGPVSFPKILFGCGHNNTVIMKGDETGVLGFGRGKVSLISQMKNLVHGKFSYCFPPVSSQWTKSTKMNFGDNAVVSGPGVVSVPLSTGLKSHESNYYVTLEAISVGDKKLEYPSPIIEGNMIIDSGSTLSYFGTYFLIDIVREVRKAINAKPVEDPLKFLKVCYRTWDNITIPTITAHFRGADVKLNAENTFVKTGKDVMCLAFAREDSISIFGNLAQINFLVGYNLEKNTISFKPTVCSKE
ncbi:hypothetical protein LguiB_011177 [Lonicera macranthoides]